MPRLPRRHALAWLLAPALLSAQPQPAPPWPGLVRQASGTMRWWGLTLYDIHLWVRGTPVTASNWRTQEFALELHYRRSFRGAQIAERSLQEMRRQGPIDATQQARWLAAMQACFPDVQDGDRLSGLHQPAQATEFQSATRMLGRVEDADFAPRFFGIWLSEHSSAPELRAALLAGSDSRA